MTQKILFLCFLIILSCMYGKTYAQTVEVEALDNISTAEPAGTISIKLVEPLELTIEQILNSGVLLKGNITHIL